MGMKKAIAIICAALVGGGTVAGIAYKSKGFTDWSKENWLTTKQSKPTDETQNSDTDSESIEGGILVSTENKATAMRLNAVRTLSADDGISTQADASYTISATITPANADNQAVYWDVAWKNASSSWASGKNVNNYITLNEDGLNCTVSPKAAFGEKIIITCTSFENANATASCTVDYVKRITLPHGNGYVDIDRMYQNGNTEQTFKFDTTMIFRARASEITYGTGTVTGTLDYGKISFSVPSDVQTSVKNNSGCSDFGSRWTFKSVDFGFGGGINTSITVGDAANYFITYMGDPSAYRDKLHAAFVTAFRNGGKIHAEVNFEYVYGDTVISDGKAASDLTVNTDGLAINVSSVAVDTPSLAL